MFNEIMKVKSFAWCPPPGTFPEMSAVLPSPVSNPRVKERIRAAQHAVCPVSGRARQHDQRLRWSPENEGGEANADVAGGRSLWCG